MSVRQQSWALDKYFEVLWRRKWVLIAPVILGVAVAAAATTWVPQLTPRLYETTATGRLALAGRAVAGQQAIDEAEADRLRDTFILIVENESNVSNIIRDLQLDVTPDELMRRVRIEPVDHTELVRFTANAETAEEARAIANAFLAAWVDRGEALNNSSLGSSFFAVEQASLPASAIGLPWAGRVGLGFAVGLVVGLCLAFVFEYTDRTINSVKDLDVVTVPVLSAIPRLKSKSRKRVSLARGRSSYDPLESAQARLLTIKLLHAMREQKLHSILVLSSWPKEGTSSVATSVAFSMARSGLDLLLVDAQFSEPALHKVFNLPPDRPGLTDVLSSVGKPEEASVVVKKATMESDEPGLSVLTIGSRVAEPWNLLSSAGMRHVVESDGPLMIIDGPPLSSSADSLALASIVGGVLIVCSEGKNTTEDLNRSLVQLESMRANILGIVYNKAKSKKSLAGYGVRG